MQMDNVALDTRCVFLVDMGTVTPAATAASGAVEQEFTVPAGTPALKTTDFVTICTPGGAGNKLALGGARVTTPTKIKVNFVNGTAGSLTYTAGTFLALIVRG